MLRLKAISILGFLTLSCQSAMPTSARLSDDTDDSYTLRASVFDTASQENPNSPPREYVSLAVPYVDIQKLKEQLAHRTGFTLKDRGEAHITVLTPPELSTLRKKLSPDVILRMVDVGTIQSESFSIVCVGEGKKANRRVYFVVVKASGLLGRRQTLASAFEAAGGSKEAFNAGAYYPHITIGFTHSDLFEQDGVTKDERSCVASVRMI